MRHQSISSNQQRQVVLAPGPQRYTQLCGEELPACHKQEVEQRSQEDTPETDNRIE